MGNISTLNTSLLFNSNMGTEVAQIVGQLDALTRSAQTVTANLKGIDLPNIDPIELPQPEVPQPVVPEAETSNALASIKSFAVKAAATLGILKGATELVSISDDLTLMNARITSILKEEETLAGIQQAAFESAQRSRADYLMTLDSIGKLGNQAGENFTSTQEIINFTEQLNKHFINSGASADGMRSAVYQLNQAMAMGVLRGEEFNAVNENAPSVIQAIADYMGVAKGEIRELAFEGQITADIVKNALFDAAVVTDEKFKEIPMTFEQIKQSVKNNFIQELQPALQSINDFFNSDIFSDFVGYATSGLGQVASLTAWAVELLITGFTFAAEAAEHLQVPILMLVGILGLYNGVIMAKAAAEGISAFASSVMADGLFKATAAQLGLNTAILTSPIFWIPALIMGIIGIIFGVVGAINMAKGESISAVGVVVGVLNTALAFCHNLFGGFWNFIVQMLQALTNGFISIAEFIGNVFINPVGAVRKLFYDLVIFVTEALGGIAQAVDALLGTDFSGSVNTFLDGVHQRSLEANADVYSLPEADLSRFMLERQDYSEAFNSGYSTGQNLQTNISSLISNIMPSLDPVQLNQNAAAMPELGAIPGIGDDINALKDNTKSIDKAVNGNIKFENEDLTYLREAATARAIQNFSFDKVVVQVDQQFGDIHENADFNKFIDGINDGLNEAIATIGTTAGGGAPA